MGFHGGGFAKAEIISTARMAQAQLASARRRNPLAMPTADGRFVDALRPENKKST